MNPIKPEIAARIPLHPNDYLVLFTLSKGECHGYGITKDIEDQTEGLVRIDPSNLYRAMKRLVQDEMVEEAGRRRPEGKEQRRRFYRITPFGRQVLKAEARRMAALAEAARSTRLIEGGA